MGLGFRVSGLGFRETRGYAVEGSLGSLGCPWDVLHLPLLGFTGSYFGIYVSVEGHPSPGLTKKGLRGQGFSA